MKRRVLLKKIMTMARTGEADSFQNFYILTVSETYGKLFALLKEKKRAEEVLIQVYLSLYHQVHTLPIEEEELTARIEKEIFRQSKSVFDEGEAFPENLESFPEERAATLWMQLEELAGLNQENTEDEMSFKSYIQTGLRIAGAAAAFLLVFVVLRCGWNYILSSKRYEKTALQTEAEAEESPAEIVIEKERLDSGWKQNNGSLFYVDKSGKLAEGQFTIGKQLLTFSKTGELTLIGSSQETAQNRNLSFDEDVCYEVKNGDVYCQKPDEEEFCVIRNGHVVQADARCGFLWYICEYQIPNSDQVRTAINRASLDGREQTEVYSTNAILETGSFQVTSEWYYYLLDGKLFRKSLEDGKTELLARDAEYYFAWNDTAYYMKDRTLVSASRGLVYSGMAAGYNIEKTKKGFALLNELGETIPASGSGEIQLGDRIYQVKNGIICSVVPAERRSASVTYYIDKGSADRKLYWKDSKGSRGLLAQEGIAVDSFCIAGEWLYYSARIAEYGAEYESQIYRMSLQNSQTEAVGKAFRGMMRNLYYFENVQTVYGEYIDSVADPEEIHGSIAKVSEKQTGVVNDTTVRPKSSQSDMLELLMVNEGRIYCLYHKCSYDAGTGELVFESTEPLEIELRK